MELENNYDFISPNHYKPQKKELWERMIEVFGTHAYKTFCEMNAFKYMNRLGLKPGQSVRRDLEKAKWYLNKSNEIEHDKLSDYERGLRTAYQNILDLSRDTSVDLKSIQDFCQKSI